MDELRRSQEPVQWDIPAGKIISWRFGESIACLFEIENILAWKFSGP